MAKTSILASGLFFVCLTGASADPITVQFAQRCRVRNAVTANGRVYLLIAKNALGRPCTGAYVEGEDLNHWAGAIGLRDLAGLGRTSGGELIVAERIRGIDSDAAIGFFVPVNLSTATRVKALERLELLKGEEFISFFPSTPEFYLTSHRIGRPDNRVHHRFLEHPLTRAGPGICADMSDDYVLWSAPPTAPGNVLETFGAIRRIDVKTGAIEDVKLAANSGEIGRTPEDPPVLYDPSSERISGVIADPLQPNAYYVAVGHMGGAGRLLHVDRDLRCRVAVSLRSPRIHGMLGIPDYAPMRDEEQVEQPILAVARSAADVIHFVTYQGLYALDQGGDVRFIGVPQFAVKGGFYVATNLREFVIILSVHHTWENRRAAQRARVHLVSMTAL